MSNRAWAAMLLALCTACSGSGSSDQPDGAVPGSSDGNAGGTLGVETGASTGADSGGSEAGDELPGPAPIEAGPDSALPGWTLTWSDEFDGPDGSAADPTKWTYDTGGTGWGNGEYEYYTSGTDNAVVQGGDLVITATTVGASQYTCSYPSSGPCKYTSARLKTQGLFAQEYGLFEARVQMPTGTGLWPAVWMLGSNITTVSWPACGEIDFMETIGSDITTNHGSLHMPNDNPTGTFTLPDGGSFAEDFHVFSTEWDPGSIKFYVDGELYETQAQSSVPTGGTWEFDHPFFLIMNVAVGGTWPGAPSATTTFPQTMKVDWVRVYQRDNGDP